MFLSPHTNKQSDEMLGGVFYFWINKTPGQALGFDCTLGGKQLLA